MLHGVRPRLIECAKPARRIGWLTTPLYRDTDMSLKPPLLTARPHRSIGQRMPSIQENLAEADKLLARGDYSTALLWLAVALKDDPKNVMLRYRAGVLLR